MVLSNYATIRTQRHTIEERNYINESKLINYDEMKNARALISRNVR